MAGRRRQNSSSLNPNITKGIIAIILVIFSCVVTLSFFQKAGAIGVILDEFVLSFLFGKIRYAAPAVLLVISWYLIKRVDYDYRPTHGIGIFLFFLTFSGLTHLGFEPTKMWSEALAGNGGGVFGMFAWPLKTYLGGLASIIILIGLALVSIILVFNTAIAGFIFIHKKFIAGLGFIGKFIINSVAGLFIKKPEQVKFKINGEYENNNNNADEEIKPKEPTARMFAKKTLAENETEETADAADKKNESSSAETKSNPADIWSKKVIVKNLPPTDLLSDKKSKPTSGDIKSNAEIIKDTFEQFGIEVSMGEVRVGPTVTQYTLKPAKGVKLSKITGLSNDLALSLAAHPIRIEAPIPGKSLVGVEVPNQKTALVSFKELIDDLSFKTRNHNLMLALGKDVAGKVWFADLPKMPHLLIAGATGSGKTVCVNTIIMGLLFQNTAETLRFIMVDPKRVELTLYNGIPHLLTPVITNVQKTVNALKWTIGEMERRFEVLASVGSRDITSYNQKNPFSKMPHIVFVIDELADLMATAAGEVEAGIIRIAQMARAVGIHLIVATQRPSVDVITGLMKANIPSRIAFSVASLIDSRTILDCPGAEKLLGRGDMLFGSAELSKPVRIQGSFISEDEMKNVVDYLKGDEEPQYEEELTIAKNGDGGTLGMFGGPTDEQDTLFNDAKDIVTKAGKASASLLQRRMKIGYARAARILDELEAAGLIGQADGAKPRDVFVTDRAESDTMGSGGDLSVFEEAEIEEIDVVSADEPPEETREETN
ncbi:MAG: DNA translocase FtsK 4TM domain-containing protein, partial [Patescibacteria group bacterium]